MAAGLLQAQDIAPATPSQTIAEGAPGASPADQLSGISAPAVAEPVESTAAVKTNTKRTSRWFVRVGGSRALYNSSATFTANGQRIKGGSARVTDGNTLIFDVGYDLSDNVAVMFTGGIPPSADVLGEGVIAPYGKLGWVRFGTVVLTAVYRFPEWHRFRPYAGAGVGHLVILKTRDAAVKGLKVQNNNAFVLQAGIEYRLDRNWELFADYKRLWLNVKAEGALEGSPFRARVVLNPDVISAGIKFHFR